MPIGLIFDMDGLLLDSEIVVKQAWDVAGKRLGYGADFGNHIYSTIGFNVVRREEYFRTHVSQNFDMNSFNQYSREAYHHIANTKGIAKKIGALELLSYAKEQGYAIAVATSSRREHASWLLQKQGLLDFFSGQVYGDMVTVSKPHPEIYRKACAQIGCEPHQCIAFEDSPAGILSAKAAGLTTVMIPDLVQPPESLLAQIDKLFPTLLDVIPWLEQH